VTPIIRENKFAMMPFRQICAEKLDRRDIVVRPYLDRAGKLMCDWAIRALREVRIELGYEDQAEQLFLPI
jgi:hypothetical protein